MKPTIIDIIREAFRQAPAHVLGLLLLSGYWAYSVFVKGEWETDVWNFIPPAILLGVAVAMYFGYRKGLRDRTNN